MGVRGIHQNTIFSDTSKLLFYFVVLFFGGGRGSNHEPCIYYALFIPIELSSRGHFIS